MLNRKRILVTGSSGFLGSHLVDLLMLKGHKVIGLDVVKPKHKQKLTKFVEGDILDKATLKYAMDKCKYVYHLAAEADIDRSIIEPEKTIRYNILGTQNVLHTALEINVERVIFASSIYVYSHLGGFYRVSKQSCEKLIEEYERVFGLNYTIVRYGSIYGPGANYFNSIYNMITEAVLNKKIVREGNGKEIRQYIHIKDAISLTYELMDDYYENKFLLITGKEKFSINKLLNKINSIFDNKIDIEYVDGETNKNHYHTSPFSNSSINVEELFPDSSYDLNQGLKELKEELEKKLRNKNNNH